MSRKPLYTAEHVHKMFARMRNDLHEMHSRHLGEMADLRRELEEVHAAYAELRATVLARQNAERELTSLYRERDIARARAAERDPALPLH